jgi:hypothetical protein
MRVQCGSILNRYSQRSRSILQCLKAKEFFNMIYNIFKYQKKFFFLLIIADIFYGFFRKKKELHHAEFKMRAVNIA